MPQPGKTNAVNIKNKATETDLAMLTSLNPAATMENHPLNIDESVKNLVRFPYRLDGIVLRQSGINIQYDNLQVRGFYEIINIMSKPIPKQCFEMGFVCKGQLILYFFAGSRTSAAMPPL